MTIKIPEQHIELNMWLYGKVTLSQTIPNDFTGVRIGEYIFIHKRKTRENYVFNIEITPSDVLHYWNGFEKNEFDFFGHNINDYRTDNRLRVYVNGQLIKEFTVEKTNCIGHNVATDIMAIMISRVITKNTTKLITFYEMFQHLFDSHDFLYPSLNIFGVFALTKDMQLRFVQNCNEFIGNKHNTKIKKFDNILPLSIDIATATDSPLSIINYKYPYFAFRYLAVDKQANLRLINYVFSPDYLRYYDDKHSIVLSTYFIYHKKSPIIYNRKMFKSAIKQLLLS